jgi:ubiquinone/menaquinone biosynthesis C-methylase UbiE
MASISDRVEFAFIKFIHGTLMGAFVDPLIHLTSAGINEGMTVLEAGFGPGFFTLPAAEMVGPSGHLYALELNQVALDHVRRKIEEGKFANLTLLLQDVTATEFDEESIDLAFFFGIFHKFPDPTAVLQEMHRILKPEGIIAIQAGRVPTEKIIDQVEESQMFKLEHKDGKILRFVKT